jgi:peptidase E
MVLNPEKAAPPPVVYLHGGNSGLVNASNDTFFRTMVEPLPDPATVLLVGFAKKKEYREPFLAAARAQLERNRAGRTLNIVEATEDAFVEQVRDADLVFLLGGNTESLLLALRSFPGLVATLARKTLAGESAGAYALSSWFFSKTIGECRPGLGLAPAAIICHYTGLHAERLPSKPGISSCLLADFEFRAFTATAGS